MPKKTLKQYYGDYTADVIFKKGQGYMTKAQEKEQRESEKAKRMENRANLAAGQAPAVPTSAPAATPVPVGNIPIVPLPTSSPATTAAPTADGVTPPPWWIGQAYSNPNEQQSFANAANALLPTLSPEDQRTMANYLATNYKDVFGGYSTAQFAPIPTKLGSERMDYLNPQRAQAALSILDRVKQAAGGTPGAGYDFLSNALNLMNQYSTQGSPMTREQYNQFQTAIKNMVDTAGKDLSAYSNLAQMFNLPSFSAGPMVSNAPIPGLNV